jgi:hypothetical protein
LNGIKVRTFVHIEYTIPTNALDETLCGDFYNACLGRYFVVLQEMSSIPPNLYFVKAHGDLIGKKFSEVYETRPDFVKFTKTWTAARGEYKSWYNYVKLRDEQKDKQVTE